MNQDFFEQIKLYLPKYLTPENQQLLYSELRTFPNNKNFYLSGKYPDNYLQGDGWTGFIAIGFETLKKKSVSGVIISNSCDIDPNNKRDRKPNILFAPLIRLSKFEELLQREGKKKDDLSAILSSLRRQEITSIFYLPEDSGPIRESLILLDDIHQQPLHNFHKVEKSKIFTLNQYAFYLFLIKLSIHFSRFNEGVNRFA